MFFFLKKKTSFQALINEQNMTVHSKETVLAAALRQGISMAHSCRAGGCGTCKCQLLEGEIKALTDFSYILNGEELEKNYILACQSVAKSNLKIRAIINENQQNTQQVSGRIVAQKKLTHDIVHVRIRVDSAFNYFSGQYAELALAEHPQEFRSFSFASPATGKGEVEFFVRKVANGLITTKLCDQDLIGHEVKVRAPYGEFYLRPSQSPLLFIAGGSGLAPIKAILDELQAQPQQPKITLLFGARQQHDLYLLNEISAMQQSWTQNFEFIPVLSEEDEASDWSGKRGLVTEHIAHAWLPDMQVYVCGPPPMVTAASNTLQTLGANPQHIFSDSFLTGHLSVAS